MKLANFCRDIPLNDYENYKKYYPYKMEDSNNLHQAILDAYYTESIHGKGIPNTIVSIYSDTEDISKNRDIDITHIIVLFESNTSSS